MKVKNRILSAVMAIAACMTFVGTTVFADAPALSATPSTVEVKAGETFTIDVATVNNPGIVDLYVIADATNETFELKAVEDKKLYSGATMDTDYSKAEYLLCWWMDDTFSNNTTTSGTVATLTYKVKDAVEPGDYTISFATDVDNTYCAAGDPVDFGSVTATIKVVADAPAGPAYTVATESDVNAAVNGYYTKGFQATVAATGETAEVGKIAFTITYGGKTASDDWSNITVSKVSTSFAVNVINIPENVEATDLAITWDVDGVEYLENTNN